jgi:hypothetical protein
MRRRFLKILAATLLTNVAAYGQAPGAQAASGQSLGEVARELRQKQNSEEPSGAHAKVITNQDLGEGPDGRPDLRQAPRAANYARGSADFDRRPGQPRMAEERAEQWRSRILEQKGRVTALQARIDQINAAMHSGAQFEGPRNRYQAHQAEQLAQMQLQLDEQRRRLEEMQEAARRAGMHTAVYDP